MIRAIAREVFPVLVALSAAYPTAYATCWVVDSFVLAVISWVFQ